jgi:hypothetical protein
MRWGRLEPVGLTLVGLLAAGACAGEGFGSDGPNERVDGGAHAPDGDEGEQDGGLALDAGLGAGLDAGRQSPAPSPFYADPSRDRPDGDPRSGFEGSESAGAANPGLCYDGADNDSNGRADCSDRGCQTLRACCVGSGDCCSSVATPSLPAQIPLQGGDCPEGTRDAASCLSEAGMTVSAFGTPASKLEGGAFLPNGDEQFDSGLVLGDPVDLSTRRLELEVRFGGASGCGVSCLEGAGVALTTERPTGETYVEPRVGLVLSGANNQVRLVVAGETVARASLLDSPESTWRLVVRPTGALTWKRGDESLAEVQFVPSPNAHLVLFGRNRQSVSASESARIEGLSVASELCDVPRAWSDAEPLELHEGGAAVGSPSLAYDGSGRAVLAYEERRSGGSVIRVARAPAGEGLDKATLANDAAQPALEGGRAHDQGGVRDPELVWDAQGGRWVLLYTAIAVDGTRSIGRAVMPADGTQFAADDSPVLEPSGQGVLGISQPTVARRSDGRWALVALSEVSEGHSRFAVFLGDEGDAGQSWASYSESNLGEVADPVTAQRPEGFVVDEIADPSLIIHNGAWQLYYARRRGTDWSVGLLASDGMLYWRHLASGYAVFEGGTGKFDRLGVSGPDAVSGDGRVELLHVGRDGVRPGLGLVSRAATDRGAYPQAR